MIASVDICILGAGPGGMAAALQLEQMGIRSLVLEKSSFPRDKVCGDALSGKVVYHLNRINPAIVAEFRERTDLKVDCWGVEFVFPQERSVALTIPNDLSKVNIAIDKASGFVAKREDFDNYLACFLQRSDLIELRENTEIQAFEKLPNNEGYLLSGNNGSYQVKAKLLLVADGAQSRFARTQAGITKEPSHYAAAVRAYFRNVGGVSAYHFIELHYIKGFSPGYLWIFPLPNGAANVGVGMRSDILTKRKINLAKSLTELLSTHPRFKDRFANATLEGGIKGFGLPLGSKKRSISGDHFLLLGDAASLIDPLTGEGVGNAIVSGRIAAEYAAVSLATGDFSASRLKAYDQAIYQKLWKELRLSAQVQSILGNPLMIQLAGLIAHKNKRFQEIVNMIFNDTDFNEKKLYNPLFYLDLLRKKYQSFRQQ